MSSSLNQAILEHKKGNHSQAEKCYLQHLKQFPSDNTGLNLLGTLYLEMNIFDKARDAFHVSANKQVRDWYAKYGLGVAQRHLKQHEEADRSLRAAIQRNPRSPLAYHELCASLAEQKKWEQAFQSVQKALKLDPSNAELHYILACCYYKKGKIDTAFQAFEKAISLQPNHDAAYRQLSILYREQKEGDLALAAIQKAVEINPQGVENYLELAELYKEARDLDKAHASYRHSLELQPKAPQVHYLLALFYLDIGDLAKGHHHLEECLRLEPTHSDAESALLFFLLNLEGTTSQQILTHTQQCLKHHLPAISPFKIRSKKEKEKVLRIGYLSPDLYAHPVFFFLYPLLQYHDRQQFKVYAYSSSRKEDEKTFLLKEHCDEWRNIHGLEPHSIAKIVQRDQIDILVDLAGHTSPSHLLPFAYKPAPIQISYLGYPATSGLKEIEYRIGDAYVDLNSEAPYYTETLLALPHCFLSYTPPKEAPSVQTKTDKEKFTFASLNHLRKITPDVIKVWSQILRQVPHARLLMKSRALSSEIAKEYYLRLFVEQEIEKDRIQFIGYLQSTQEHLALYNSVDLALDSFPYNGTTTTFEALWMETPVLTLSGKTHLSRVSGSILSDLGLHNYITDSKEAYIARAVKYAQEGLPPLDLRKKLQKSTLCSGEQFTPSLESIYRKAWYTYCES